MSLPNSQASVAVSSLGLLDLVQIAAEGPCAQVAVQRLSCRFEPWVLRGAASSGSVEDESRRSRDCSGGRPTQDFSWHRCRRRFTQIPNRYQIRRPVAGRAPASQLFQQPMNSACLVHGPRGVYLPTALRLFGPTGLRSASQSRLMSKDIVLCPRNRAIVEESDDHVTLGAGSGTPARVAMDAWYDDQTGL